MENKGRLVVNKELDYMPDHSNANTRATEQELGEFVFDQVMSPRQALLLDKGPLVMDNGAIYHG